MTDRAGHAEAGSTVSEAPQPGPVPRFEIPHWRERFGVVAGVTARGDGPPPGFDLGLRTRQPVGEVMTRWDAFRGVEPGLARLVAEQLMAHDELGAHMRDELGITEVAAARPFQAAWASVLAFTVGAVFPVVAIVAAPYSARIPVCAVVSLLALIGLGALGAFAGGAPWHRAAARVVVWSSLAMGLTFAIGHLVGTQL